MQRHGFRLTRDLQRLYHGEHPLGTDDCATAQDARSQWLSSVEVDQYARAVSRVVTGVLQRFARERESRDALVTRASTHALPQQPT
jgi:hypothetical protein